MNISKLTIKYREDSLIKYMRDSLQPTIPTSLRRFDRKLKSDFVFKNPEPELAGRIIKNALELEDNSVLEAAHTPTFSTRQMLGRLYLNDLHGTSSNVDIVRGLKRIFDNLG